MKKKIKILDSLKGIGSLFIFFSHMKYLSESKNSLTLWIWENIMSKGYVFTSLFFIISGFLLAYSWKEKPFSKYIVGKLKNIYPLTFLVLILSIAIDIILNNESLLGKGVQVFSKPWYLNILFNLTLIKAFIPYEKVFYSFHGPSWYISALFGLYIIGYILLKNKKNLSIEKMKKYFKSLSIIAIITVLLELLICIFIDKESDFNLYFTYINPLYRIFSEGLIGIIICMKIVYFKRDKISKRANLYELISLLIIVFSFGLINIIKMNINKSLIWSLVFGFFIYVFIHQKGKFSKLLNNKYLLFLGRISFELYMTHAFVNEGLPIIVSKISNKLYSSLILNVEIRFILTFILSIIFACIVHFMVIGFNKTLKKNKNNI